MRKQISLLSARENTVGTYWTAPHQNQAHNVFRATEGDAHLHGVAAVFREFVFSFVCPLNILRPHQKRILAGRAPIGQRRLSGRSGSIRNSRARATFLRRPRSLHGGHSESSNGEPGPYRKCGPCISCCSGEDAFKVKPRNARASAPRRLVERVCTSPSYAR